MAYKQNPGRGPMMKTGYGVPSALLQEDKKAKVGEVPGYEEIKERFKGKYTVTPRKGNDGKPKPNEYTLMDKSGHSVGYSAGPKVEDKSKDIVDILNTPTKKNK
jgi:hypothetical protein